MVDSNLQGNRLEFVRFPTRICKEIGTKTRVFQKKRGKHLAVRKKGITFALAYNGKGSVAQLNRASDYGSEGCGFESRRNHEHKEDPEMKTCFQSRVLFYVCKISP